MNINPLDYLKPQRMTETPITVKIKGKFDLGYIVTLSDGTEAQLRMPEQKGRLFDYHLDGNEELLYGESIEVYLIYRDEKYCAVSQYSPSERQNRERIKELKKLALQNCQPGQTYNVQVKSDYDWGYVSEEVNGYLQGAILKPCALLSIGQLVSVKIVEKRLRNVLFELSTKSNGV